MLFIVKLCTRAYSSGTFILRYSHLKSHMESNYRHKHAPCITSSATSPSVHTITSTHSSSYNDATYQRTSLAPCLLTKSAPLLSIKRINALLCILHSCCCRCLLILFLLLLPIKYSSNWSLIIRENEVARIQMQTFTSTIL